MFRRLYHWTLKQAESRHAGPSLAVISFAESSFFPIPPDVMLAPMALAQPKRAFYFAAVCSIASVLGGIFGYVIGYFLFETVGQWLMELYGYTQKIDAMRVFYDKWGWAAVLIGGLTPVPFKLITIISGLLEYNFLLFVFLAALTRSLRFFVLAGILYVWGEPIKALIDKYFTLIMIAITLGIIGGFVAVGKFF
jgi:membrane protein YqaA with SNARE-associated domain